MLIFERLWYNGEMEVQPKVGFFTKHPLLKDLLSLAIFVTCVVAGTMLLNAFVFRSYNVVGQSMENTFHNNDRVIVNRLPVTWAHFMGQEYVPKRGDVIVFANVDAEEEERLKQEKADELGVDVSEVGDLLTCAAPAGQPDQYLIKRVIAFPGERVTVKDGVMKVYNDEWPDGYEVDELWRNEEEDTGPKKDVSGQVDMTVPEGEIFVAGDNREGQHSFDSRSGLGTIPYCRIIGPVAMRIYPLNKVSFF